MKIRKHGWLFKITLVATNKYKPLVDKFAPGLPAINELDENFTPLKRAMPSYFPLLCLQHLCEIRYLYCMRSLANYKDVDIYIQDNKIKNNSCLITHNFPSLRIFKRNVGFHHDKAIIWCCMVIMRSLHLVLFFQDGWCTRPLNHILGQENIQSCTVNE